MNGFVKFEIVIGREQGDGLVDVSVVENFWWNLVQSASGSSGRCDCNMLSGVIRDWLNVLVTLHSIAIFDAPIIRGSIATARSSGSLSSGSSANEPPLWLLGGRRYLALYLGSVFCAEVRRLSIAFHCEIAVIGLR